MAVTTLPGKYDLTGLRAIYRGDTRTWPVTFQHNDGTEDEPELVPIDLSGCTFRAQIRATKDDPDVMAVIEVDDADAATGVLVLTLTAEEAEQLEGTSAYWDLEVTTTATDVVHTYLAGKVKIVGDVSRAWPTS